MIHKNWLAMIMAAGVLAVTVGIAAPHADRSPVVDQVSRTKPPDPPKPNNPKPKSIFAGFVLAGDDFAVNPSA